MWAYWRDKKGYEQALVQQYTMLLENTEELRFALAQLKAAERNIDAIMTKEDSLEDDR